MLSILIPTYNYVCAHLVCELQKQCEEAQALWGEDFQYEIIVADDGSTDGATIEKNAVIEYLPNCRFIDNDRNMGRAAIRNLLVRESRGEWIVIIDCDAEVVTDDFVQRYWQATHSCCEATHSCCEATHSCCEATVQSASALRESIPADIIIGGICTPATAPEGCELRHRYELAADAIRTIEARQSDPAMFFSTFNFMASRRVFDTVKFDERCTEYGYEDALFGIDVEQCGFRFAHIDNPLQHNGINDNASFLRNSETALRTLRHLGPPMTDRARVASAARRLTTPAWRKYTISPLIIILYKMSRPFIRRNLLSRHPNLNLFAFYKLGYYLSL